MNCFEICMNSLSLETRIIGINPVTMESCIASRKNRCVSKGYPLTLPYIVFLKSFMNSVEDFSGGIIPSYLPRSSSETFFEDSEGTDNDLIELTASFNVVDSLNTSFKGRLTKGRNLFNEVGFICWVYIHLRG